MIKINKYFFIFLQLITLKAMLLFSLGCDLANSISGQLNDGGNNGDNVTVNLSLSNSNNFNLDESNSSSVITYTLDRKITKDTRIDWAIHTEAGGNAGTDFTQTTGSITIPGGNKSVDVVVPLIDDDIYEGTEKFILSFIYVSEHVNLLTDRQDFEIADNEPLPTVAFENLSQSAHENDGTVEVVLSISPETEVPVEVTYSINGTATGGSDYTTPSSTTVTFTAGETTKTISIQVTDDGAGDDGESIDLTIDSAVIAGSSDPVNIDSGSDNHTITLNDPNYAPNITQTCATTISQDSNYTCNPAAVDPESDPFTWALDSSNTCSWAIINSSSGAITGIPNDNDVGSCTIAFKANDGYRDSAVETVSVTVSNVQPTLTIANTTMALGLPATVIRADAEVEADEEGFGVYSLTSTAVTSPSCSSHGTLSINSTNGEITFDPDDAYNDVCYIKVQFDDENASNNTVIVEFSVSVGTPTLPDSIVSAIGLAPSDGNAVTTVVIVPIASGNPLGPGETIEVTSSSSNVVFVANGECRVVSSTCKKAFDNGDGSYSIKVKNPTSEVVNFTVIKEDASVGDTVLPDTSINFDSSQFTEISTNATITSAWAGQNLHITSGTIIFDASTIGMNLGHVNVSGGTITHLATDSTTIHRLDLNVSSLNLNGTGKIDVSAKGFLDNEAWSASGSPSTALGAVPVSDYGAGGSHGGMGGKGNNASSDLPGPTFGSYRQPYFPGGGPGENSNNKRGGGVVKITSNGACTFSDTANMNANGQWPGGAGGSIWLTCNRFHGSANGAVLSVDGEAGGYTNPIRNWGGGGGGRIALISTGDELSFTGDLAYPKDDTSMDAFIAKVHAFGGNQAYSGGHGAAGTIFLKHSDLNYGDLIVDNNNKALYSNAKDARTLLPSFSGTINTIVDSDSIDATMTSHTMIAGYADYFKDLKVRPDVNNNNGTPNDWTDDQVLTVSNNDGNATTRIDFNSTFSGVSAGATFRSLDILDHVEFRRSGNVTSYGDLYAVHGTITNPDTNPIVLGAGSYSSPTGGSMNIQISQYNLTLGHVYHESLNAGSILLNGGSITTTELTTTGGSPYSIDIQSGSLSVTNTSTVSNSFRIASGTFSTTDANISGAIQVSGGTYTASTTNVGTNLQIDSGTFSSTTTDVTTDLLVDGGQFTSTNLTVNNDMTQTAGTQTLENVTVVNDIVLSGGIMNHPYTSNTDMYRLVINANSFTMSNDASINISERGYTHSRAWSASGAPSTALGAVAVGDYAAGGSHGGTGGYGTNLSDAPGPTYGDYRAPFYPGGGPGDTGVATRGGGAIKINSTNACAFSGTSSIKANGQFPGGAGGSIWLNCNAVSGLNSAPILTADGADGGYLNPARNWGGGGGGRIAITIPGAVGNLTGDFTMPTDTTTLDAFISKVHAFGGSLAYTGSHGGAGTIYIKHSGLTYGDLIVDNNYKPYFSHTKDGRTHLPSFSGAIDTFIDTDSFDGNISALTIGTGYTDYIKGLLIRPDVNNDYGTPNDWTDDQILTVSTNNENNPTQLDFTTTYSGVSVGSTFRSIDILDHIEFRNSGNVTSYGDIFAVHGMLTNPDTDPVTFTAGSFDSLDGGALNIQVTNYQLNAGHVYKENITLDNIVVNGGSLSAENLTTSGGAPYSIDIQSGTITVTNNANISNSMRIVSGNFSAPNLQIGTDLLINGGTVAIGDTTTVSNNLTMTSGTYSAITTNVGANLQIDDGTFTSTTTNVTTNLLVNGGQLTSTNLTVNNNMTQTAGTQTLQNVTVVGALTMDGGLMNHPAASTSAIYRLVIDAASFTMNNAASINVSGKGYTTTYSWSSTGAPSTLTGAVSANYYGAGGAHGGTGGIGNSDSYTSGLTYGDYKAPYFPGGGPGDFHATIRGGGVVKINASGACSFNGTSNINATGQLSGGAGGSIWLTCASFSGSTTADILLADGADGGYFNNARNWGGGGGGRIAMISTGNSASLSGDFIYDTDASTLATFLTKVHAYGGALYSSGGNGAAGTIYIKHTDLSDGDMIIWNNNRTIHSRNGSTKFLSSTANSNIVYSATAASDTLNITNGGTPFYAEYYAGSKLHIFSTSASIDPLDGSHTLLNISSNDTNTIVDSSASLPAIASDYEYRFVFPFNHLHISGNAAVDFDGGDVILNTSASDACDISSASTGDFVVPTDSSIVGNTFSSANCPYGQISTKDTTVNFTNYCDGSTCQ